MKTLNLLILLGAAMLALTGCSMLQIMQAFASYVDVPALHVKEQRATPAFEDAAAGTRHQAVRIHSGKEKPADSFVAVQYRGHWFWINDGDRQTKRVMTAIMFFFTLAETAMPGSSR